MENLPMDLGTFRYVRNIFSMYYDAYYTDSGLHRVSKEFNSLIEVYSYISHFQYFSYSFDPSFFFPMFQNSIIYY